MIGDMKVVTIIARILLGLVFVFFGSNAFLHFLPMPPMTGHPGDSTASIHPPGYLKAIAALQGLAGRLLPLGPFVHLGLIFLVPIIVTIDLFYSLMDLSDFPMD